MPYRRFYFRGSITFGVFSWLHRFQFSINSSRCSLAHSNTNFIARSGKEPRMSRKSRKFNQRFVLGVQRMEVRRRMIMPKHLNHDAIKDADRRHKSKSPTRQDLSQNTTQGPDSPTQIHIDPRYEKYWMEVV